MNMTNFLTVEERDKHKTFWDKVWATVLEREIPVKEFVDLIGITVQECSDAAKGNIADNLVSRIADVLDVDVDDLWGEWDEWN